MSLNGPRLSPNVIFEDNFTHREGLLNNWTDDDAAFNNDIRPGIIEVVSAGELVYNGTSLEGYLGDESSETDADWAIRLVLRSTDNLKLTLRGRRQDADNFIGFHVDFENDVAQLIKTIDGSPIILEQTEHQFREDGFNTYVLGLWMQGTNIHGYVNHFNLTHVLCSSFRTSQGFSIHVPEINESDPPKLFGVYVHRTNPQNDPQLTDPSNLLVQARLLMKEEIENPATYDWTTFKKAQALWRTYKDQGYSDEQWEEFGYPMHRPTSEEWFASLYNDPTPVVTAYAGADQEVNSGDSITLDASESAGTGSSPLVYQWTQTWGPTVSIADPSSAEITLTVPEVELEPFAVRFEVSVSQDDVTDTDEVMITVTEVRDNPSEAQVLAWMQELDPLPKVHYSFAVHYTLYHPPLNSTLYEYVRLTNVCSIRTRWPVQDDVNMSVQACKLVNDTNPTIPATLALNFSPWHMVFPADSPPTDMGPDHDAEIEFFRDTAEQFIEWIDEANDTYDSSIEVSAILIDSERFYTKLPTEDGWEEWNEAIDIKHNAIYTIAQELFPYARIERYLRGAIIPCENYNTWCTAKFYTLNELGNEFNVDLYYRWFTDLMSETFQLNCDKAETYGTDIVMPWVALAAGWARTGETSRDWVYHDYDTEYSWKLGALLNEQPYYDEYPLQTEWNKADVVCFYPTPFNANIPAWGKHFVAYVCGAHGLDNITE